MFKIQMSFVAFAILAITGTEAVLAWHYLKLASNATQMAFEEKQLAKKVSRDNRLLFLNGGRMQNQLNTLKTQ